MGVGVGGCCDASDGGPESGVVARAQACWARLERWASSLGNLPSLQACAEAPRLLRSPPVSCPAPLCPSMSTAGLGSTRLSAGLDAGNVLLRTAVSKGGGCGSPAAPETLETAPR